VLYVAYVLYLALTLWALTRAHGMARATGRLVEWRTTRLLMLALPPVLAAAATALLLSDVLPVRGLFVCIGGGALALGAGLVAKRALPGGLALALRIGGWSLISGVLLIPATTVLLAPLGGLAAFLVPAVTPGVAGDLQAPASGLEPHATRSDA
jgi:hypothetical protein